MLQLGFERYWYWGTGYWPILAGIGVDRVLGNIFFWLWHPIPISAHAARRSLLSKPQSNSSWQWATATMQHKYLDLLANNSGRKSRVGKERQEVHL